MIVLCALIRVASADLCPHLERLIDDYLFSVQVNSANLDLIDGFCRIMTFMAESIRRWYPVKFNFVSNEEDKYDLSCLDLDTFVNAKKKCEETMSFLEYLRQVQDDFAKQEKDKFTWQESSEENSAGKIKNHFVSISQSSLLLCRIFHLFNFLLRRKIRKPSDERRRR